MPRSLRPIDQIRIDRFVGLNTLHSNTPHSNIHSLQTAQNVRGRNGTTYKRGGCKYFGDEVAYDREARATAVHHWYPESDNEAKNRLYMISGGDIWRFTRTPDGLANASNLSPRTYVLANSEAVGFEKEKAFDGDTATEYHAAGVAGEYIGVHYRSARRIFKFVLTSVAGFGPTTAIIQGSVLGTTWVDVKAITATNVATAQTFYTDSDGLYGYWRLYVSTGFGATLQIQELKMYEECESVGSKMVFPSDMAGWSKHKHAKMVDFGDYCFAFNGLNAGVQLRLDDIDGMYQFMIDKPSTAPTLASLGVGTVDAGVHGYRYRYVREVSERVREYWGAKSDPTEITVVAGGENVQLTLVAPSDPQVTHVYIERTLANGGTYFYHSRISVAALVAAAGIITDTTTDANLSDEIDDDCRPRITGVKSATVVNDCLILYGTVADDSIVYHSLPGRPQEYPLDNYFNFYGGTGQSNNCSAYRDKLLLFKEGSIGAYAFDGNGFMQQIAVYSNFGNVSYDAVMEVKSSTENFVSFWDGKECPCLFTERGPRSIKEVSKDMGHFNFVTSDVVDIVEKQIDKNYRDFISVGYTDGHLLFGITLIGEAFNTATIAFETATQSWFGPDKGYAAGPMFTRIDGYGVHGNGELLACQDALSVRPIELDANVTKDFGGDIEFIAKTVKLGAKLLGNWFNFNQIYFSAELSNIVEVQVDFGSGSHVGSYYMAPSGRWGYDENNHFDDPSITYDEVKQSLFDQGAFDDTDFFDTVRWDVYGIPLPPYQSNWVEMTIYDNSRYSFQISSIEIQLCNRGSR
ncbi:MAG: hypothetical protein WC551_10605 [Patescibacteria group bacterium]